MTPPCANSTPPIGVVLLHYRRWPDVADTILSLRAQDVALSLVLVDNASNDGSVDAIRERFPDLLILEAPDNRGYAAGMNLGRRAFECGDLLFVTHDVRLDTAAVSVMHSHLNNGVGMVGPLLCYRTEPDRVFSSGGFDQDGVVGHLSDVPSSPRHADWLDGACLLVSREALEAAGPMDEGYFLYFEEVEFATRLRRAGWEVECVPDARAWQQPGSLPVALFIRNRLRFVARNHMWSARRRALFMTMRSALYAARRRQFRLAAAMGWGTLAYFIRIDPRLLLRGRRSSG